MYLQNLYNTYNYNTHDNDMCAATCSPSYRCTLVSDPLGVGTRHVSGNNLHGYTRRELTLTHNQFEAFFHGTYAVVSVSEPGPAASKLATGDRQ